LHSTFRMVENDKKNEQVEPTTQDRVQYPYEFDPEIRRKSHEFAGQRLKIAISSMVTYLAILVFLLFSHASEDYALFLRFIPWYLGDVLFILTLFAIFSIPSVILSYASYRLRKKKGLTEQGVRRWAMDAIKQLSVTAAFTAVGGVLLIALIALTSLWWLIGALTLIAVTALYSLLFPLFLLRIFYNISELQDEELSKGIATLANKAGISSYRIYVMNESSRSKGANAFVTGLGRTKRIVLFDNLLRKFSRPEIESVVAHELGHCVSNDTYISIAVESLFVLFAAYVLKSTLSFLLSMHLIYSVTDPNLLLWFALVAAVLEFIISPITNLYSRRREARADLFALKIAGDPIAFISGEKRLCDINMMEEDVPSWRKILFATHPTTIERIRMGESFMKVS